MPVVNPKSVDLVSTEQLSRAVVLFIGAMLALLLRDQHADLRVPPGTREAHVKSLFSKIVVLIYESIGSSRSSVMSEIRKMLRVGTDKYYRAAINELRALGKG